MAKIKFRSHDLEIQVMGGAELLNVPQQHPNVPLKFGCRRGECGVCAIHVIEGKENLTKISAQEKNLIEKKGLNENHRLACQCALNGDIVIQ